jgi:hypothetical protein
MSVTKYGLKICQVNDTEFTYVAHDLTPQIALFLFDQYQKSNFDLSKTYELFTIIIKHEDKIYFNDAIHHVSTYLEKDISHS